MSNDSKTGRPHPVPPKKTDQASDTTSPKKRKSLVEIMKSWGDPNLQTPEEKKAILKAHLKSQFEFDKQNPRFRRTGIMIVREGHPALSFPEDPVRSTVVEDMPTGNADAIRANKMIRDRLALWDPSQKGIYLHGGPSTGKKTEMYILKKRLERDMHIRLQKSAQKKPFEIFFGDNQELLQSAAAIVSGNFNSWDSPKISSQWRSAEILFIIGFGDLPPDYKTRETYLNQLMGILNERSKGFQAVKYKTFFTSRLNPKEISATLRPEIFDRIQGICNFVEMENKESLRGMT